MRKAKTKQKKLDKRCKSVNQSQKAPKSQVSNPNTHKAKSIELKKPKNAIKTKNYESQLF